MVTDSRIIDSLNDECNNSILQVYVDKERPAFFPVGTNDFQSLKNK